MEFLFWTNCLTLLGVDRIPSFSINFFSRKFAAYSNHHAEIIIVKRLIQECTNVTTVRVEPRLSDRGLRNNDAFTLSAMLLTNNAMLPVHTAKKTYYRLQP